MSYSRITFLDGHEEDVEGYPTFDLDEATVSFFNEESEVITDDVPIKLIRDIKVVLGNV
jgi:hypothetical protein